MRSEITKRVEFDAGHRIPSHGSKCRHFHGHRWVLEVTVSGEVRPVTGASDDGMVLDFGCVKKMMVELIHDRFDHAFIVYQGDDIALAALACLGSEHHTEVVPVVPTSENLAAFFFEILEQHIAANYPTIQLDKVALYETPNSRAEAKRSAFNT